MSICLFFPAGHRPGLSDSEKCGTCAEVHNGNHLGEALYRQENGYSCCIQIGDLAITHLSSNVHLKCDLTFALWFLSICKGVPGLPRTIQGKPRWSVQLFVNACQPVQFFSRAHASSGTTINQRPSRLQRFLWEHARFGLQGHSEFSVRHMCCRISLLFGCPSSLLWTLWGPMWSSAKDTLPFQSPVVAGGMWLLLRKETPCHPCPVLLRLASRSVLLAVANDVKASTYSSWAVANTSRSSPLLSGTSTSPFIWSSCSLTALSRVLLLY